MPWDSNRPVPWRTLLRQWCIYAVILLVVFLVVFRESSTVASSLIGVALSLPLFIGLNWVLYKFGYQRRTLRDLREERTAAASTSSSSSDAPVAGARNRPPSTRRTSPGHNNPRATKRRR